MTILSGNILGSPRAESDRLLQQAFVETADFRALVATTDFHVVVGRRGSGKSALFQQVLQHYQGAERVVVHSETATEHHALAAQERMEEIKANYRSGRAISRLLWRAHILIAIASRVRAHFRLKDSDVQQRLNDYFTRNEILTLPRSAYQFFGHVLEKFVDGAPNLLPGQIATLLQIEDLENLTRTALDEAKIRAIVLFDSLDEGWEPKELPTALLGGLVLASTDFVEHHTPIHTIAFVRDNMFRALAWFEPDFSRHVEGADLRLHWDETALLHMVANRIRAAFSLQAESDVKIWNRVVQRGLENRQGFERCLQNTLYRPRDVLVLLNKAFFEANKHQRAHIIDDDVAAAGQQISKDRLDDLFKEYNAVLPGLRLLAELFRSTRAMWTYGDVIAFLQRALETETYQREEAGDFEALGSAPEMFLALYSVGFLGIRQDRASPFVFCHDGARSNLANVSEHAEVAVHPCYWRALDFSDVPNAIDVVTQAYDEYTPIRSNELKDLRMLRLGQAIEELPQLAKGNAHSGAFEDWVLRAIKIVFAGSLSNVALHPTTAAGTQDRVIVATNRSTKGFWRRVLDEFGAGQILFVVKNFSELSAEDVQQAAGHAGAEFGRMVVIVYRTDNEGVSEQERRWLQDLYSRHNILALLLPARFLQRFLSKFRGRRRPEYWDNALEKRLDTHVRNYLNLQSRAVRTRRKRGKPAY